MSGDTYHFGDNVNMHGGRDNIGIVKNQAAGESGSSVETLLAAVRLLREQVSEQDREVLDDAVGTIGTDPSSSNGAVRRALASIAGIASMVGAVGVPVIEAVQGVRAALGS
ncbi:MULTISPECIES: hypothetical protein [Streptomyces]|uniref:hypothetical protein n=1 Tax=Streptomyces TaxID=1883 RepID=UPI001370BDDF|nr:hypothetical protein [Streptomyces sp. SID2888]MYV45540.1 hypothetical protein [Streptomyces sp. SID2888]